MPQRRRRRAFARAQFRQPRQHQRHLQRRVLNAQRPRGLVRARGWLRRRRRSQSHRQQRRRHRRRISLGKNKQTHGVCQGRFYERQREERRTRRVRGPYSVHQQRAGLFVCGQRQMGGQRVLPADQTTMAEFGAEHVRSVHQILDRAHQANPRPNYLKHLYFFLRLIGVNIVILLCCEIFVFFLRLFPPRSNFECLTALAGVAFLLANSIIFLSPKLYCLPKLMDDYGLHFNFVLNVARIF